MEYWKERAMELLEKKPEKFDELMKYGDDIIKLRKIN
jgi:hypothetical protein